MTTEQQQLQDAGGYADEPQGIPVVALLTALWSNRWTLLKVMGVGVVVCYALAWLLPVKFTSRASLMPPDAQTFTSTSTLAALNGPTALPSLGGGLMSTRSPAGTVIGILGSETVQDDLIQRFDLLKVYDCKYYMDARKILTARSVFDEDKKSGLVTIAVTDHDRYRSREMAQEYIDELDKLLSTLSTSSARRERMFLEGRLQTLKIELDATTLEFSKFSSKNATLNPQGQGQALVDSSTRLQGELISAQAQLSSLKAMYSEDNVRVRQARALVNSLQGQLQKLNGSSNSGSTDFSKTDESLPSIRQLPLLGATYSDLSRKLAMQEGIYETLTKQYELATVQEAKELPAIKVLDSPELPEKKSFPPRTYLALTGGILAGIAAVCFVICRELWNRTDESLPAKQWLAVFTSDL